MTLPSFLGIGAQRSGTTWLYKILREHPNIYLSDRKELHFFDRYYDRGMSWYQSFFPKENQFGQHQCIGEITPAYLFEPRVPNLISQCIPNCKFIAILRNPVERTYSEYAHSVRNNNDKRTFVEYLEQNPDAFSRSLYSEQLKRYFNLFPKENFLIFSFDEIKSQPNKVLNKIAGFLDVSISGFLIEDIGEKVNASYRPKFARTYAFARGCHRWLMEQDLDLLISTAKKLGIRKELFGESGSLPTLQPNLRLELMEKYEADISELEKLLEINLDMWRDT